MIININQYTSCIDQQQQQLLAMLHDGVASIVLPSSQKSDEITVRPQPSNGNANKALIAGGAAIVGGLFISAPLKWILIAGGAAAVLYGAYTNSQGSSQRLISANTNNEVDYLALASKVNRNLSKVNSSIINAWDDFVGEQKDKLKNEILASDADTDTKDRMLNAATSTSIVELSLSSFSVRINAASKTGNIDSFRSILADYEKEMTNAIRVACDEQKNNWINI